MFYSQLNGMTCDHIITQIKLSDMSKNWDVDYLSNVKEFCLPINFKGEFRTLCGREYKRLFYRYKYGG